jgi:uncharacterized protein (DUF58 family)
MRRTRNRTWQLPRQGRYWLILTAVLLTIGVYKGINLLLLLGHVLLAVVLLNALAAGRGLRRLRAVRRIEGPVFAGSSCRVEVELSNPNRRARVGFFIVDAGPQHSLEWFATRLAGQGRNTWRGEVVLRQRGRYDWGPLALVSGHPFGLVRRRLEVLPGEEVIVLPRVGGLHRGRLRRYLRSATAQGERLRRRPQCHPAAQAEFHGLRNYRSGDNLRLIHWRTSARRGELMVREFEDLPGENLLLVVDPSLPSWWENEAGPPEEHFEGMISLAATLCWEWCRQKGDRLVLASAGPEPTVLDGATGPDHACRTLECLALLRPGAANPGALLARLAARALPSAIVILLSVGLSSLTGPLRQALQRPVNCLDATDRESFDFYEAPELSAISYQLSAISYQPDRNTGERCKTFIS